MKVVYDSTLVLPPMEANGEFTIHLSDTFFYAGGDLIMQTIYNGTTDPAATSIKMIAAPTNKQSKEVNGVPGSLNDNPYASVSGEFSNAQNWLARRPAIVMTQHANKPLIYDLGVSRVVFPNEDAPIIDQPSHIDVMLNNYGVATINAVRISYSIDDTIDGYFDWTGSLAGGDSLLVTVNNNLTLPAGFHYVHAWVEDTLTAAGSLYRDHEPLNDTAYSEYIVCEGPLGGVRNIGGSDADYNTIEEFLFSLSRCGVGDSLVVRLAPGQYAPFTLPVINGHSSENYVVFESLDGDNMATLYADATTGANYIVDLAGAGNIRFRNLRFVRRDGALSGMVNIGNASDSCRFEGCSFIDSLENPSVSYRIPSLLNTNNSNHIVVRGCTFVGGTIGLNVQGQAATLRSEGNMVVGNVFRNQYNTGLYVQNQTDVTVDHNELYDVATNQGYVLQVMECYGTVRVTGNRVYTTHGAGAIGISGMHGTEENHVIVANNMIESRDDGTANLLTTAFNVISGEWVDVVYNTVSLTAPTRSNIPAATFGGAAITNCRYVNNIIACFDRNNYAFHYMPGTQTSNVVNHNVYYTAGISLNRRQGAAINDLETWSTVVECDSNSVVTDPGFLNGWRCDLRTFNRLVKGVGMPIAEVTVDIYDSVRGDSATCPGAFEFEALFYDFMPEALVSPMSAVCGMPDTVEMVVLIRNRGTNALVAGGETPLQLVYRVNDGEIDTVSITTTIPQEDTVSVNTGVKLHLPSNGIRDMQYSIEMWTIFAGDPNMTNDTNRFVVVSKYKANAPADVVMPISYMEEATVTVSEGIDQWNVYGSDNAPKVSSEVYWYYNMDDEEAFHVGNTITTTAVRTDTTFYVRQHRAIPIVRITQVMIKGTTAMGLTVPTPSWMTANTQVALQLTNLGDDTAYLQGDTIRSISTTNSINNKIARFGDIRLAPGESIVVQYNNGTSNSNTVYSGSSTRITPSITSNVGFVYRHNGVVVDAVAFNDIIDVASTQSVTWASQGVPDYVWSGNGVQVSSEQTGGIVRTAFNGNAADWRLASSGMPMFLNTIDSSWIIYEDNGCVGEMATVTLTITNPPTADVDVALFGEMPSGCMLGEEDVRVRVRNYGSNAIEELELNYTLGGADTVRETLTTTLSAHSDTVYTFEQRLNLAFDHDSVVNISIWATRVAADPIVENDSTSVSTISLYTAAAPLYVDSVTVEYGNSATFFISPSDEYMPVWYDYDMNPVDTGAAYTTDVLYTEGIVGVSYLVTIPNISQLGTGTSVNNKTSYPSPYQPNNKNSRQQYIYTAEEMQAAGLTEGYINSIAFYLDSIYPTITTVQGHRDTAFKDTLFFTGYSLSLAATDASVFANRTAWETTQVYFERDTMAVLRSQSHGWVEHRLDNSYYWDGMSNLVVEVAYHLDEKYTAGLQTRYTASPNTTIFYNNDTASNIAAFTGQGTLSGNRPNVQIDCAVLGCNGPIKPVRVGLVGIPQYDADIMWPDGVDTVTYLSRVDIEPTVRVRNLGQDTISEVKLHYYIDGDAVSDSTIHNVNIAFGDDSLLTLFNRQLMPGRHNVTVVVEVAGDTITGNDTISGILAVRFNGGLYSIDGDTSVATADFHSFKAAVDTLNAVGIEGSVIFSVADGIYNESVWLDNVYGTGNYYIQFMGQGDTASVRLIGNTTNEDNYVFRMSGMSRVTLQNICIEAMPQAANANAANALVLDSCSYVQVDNCTLKVKGSVYHASNASCLVLNDGGSTITITNNVIDSGYCAIKANGADNRFENIQIRNNTIRGFQGTGIDIAGVTALRISNNDIRSSATVNSRGMIGIYLSDIDSTIMIEKNRIYLLDQYNGSKRGIHLVDVMGSSVNGGFISNNMISTDGTGAASLNPKNPAGIYIDGTSQYLTIIFNSVRTSAGTTQNDTRAFYVGSNASNLQIMNNLFANMSQSYAYYVTNGNSVIWSDNNAYYTTGNTLAYWNAARASLANLQAFNSQDNNSVQDEPYFTSPSDLHLLMTNFCDMAQYNTDVMDDIDGKERPMQPRPTIGAHEVEIQEHNMTVLRITSPTMPVSINNPSNIESDPVLVTAAFYNNGFLSESNVLWYAYIEGHESTTRSATRYLGTFSHNEMKTDTVSIPTYLGLLDTQIVRVVLVCDGDQDTSDNTLTTSVYLAPAFDIQAVSVASSVSGCNVKDAPISITIKNVGYKPLPAGMQINVGYDAQAYYPTYIASRPDSNRLDIETLTTGVSESYTLTSPVNRNANLTINFNTHGNFYPTGYSYNIKVRLSGWVSYQYDVRNDNDYTGTANSSSPVIDSWYKPRPPEGHDTTFSYGTWGEVTASQENNLVIRWYRDSTASPFYLATGSNAAANSRRWSTTPIYFHDSTYYLMSISEKQCVSYFSPVTVHVAAVNAHDVGCADVLAPLGGRVYMENDTVRVVLRNYGNQSENNIPVTYQVRKGNGTAPLQTVTETCTANIPAGQSYIYTFDSLVQFESATTSGNYFLRAWTDKANDMERRNDTIRMRPQLRPAADNNTLLDYEFRTLGETYAAHTNKASDTVDIIRFSFNEIDVDLPALGRSYTNFGVFGNPDLPVLHVTRGTRDSVYIMITNPTNPNSVERGKVAVYIDFNRNGRYTDPGECVLPVTNLYNNTLLAEEIVIPDDASYGYMRMCVCATPNAGNPTSTIDGAAGHMLNFLLFVDQNAAAADLSLTQIVEPRDYLIKDNMPHVVTFRMANRGRQAITAAEIFYEYVNEYGSIDTGTVQWTGNLQPGTSTNVSLPAHTFDLGTTNLHIWHNYSGDVVPDNNSINFEYHRFHTIILTLDDDFDSLNYWYAPVGNSEYNKNFWQCGTPSKSKLNAAYSFPNAWVTDLNANVGTSTAGRGNISYLYSPIIDISQVKPDTLSFYMARNLLGGSCVYLEYYDYSNHWVKVYTDSATDLPWYNDEENNVFTNRNNNDPSTYTKYSFSTKFISGNFQERFQFRIVYKVPQTSGNRGEGCAIDNFFIGRERRRVDLGVVSILEPNEPKYGQTIYPKVVVKNYGLDPARYVEVGYTYNGVNLARMSSFNCDIAPGGMDTFLLSTPMILTSNLPDSITISAFTVNSADIYDENDTIRRDYVILPFDADISAEGFVLPRDRVVTGDSVSVVMRVRNFGVTPINDIQFTYSVNGQNAVTESVDVEQVLGRPLESHEYFNYTFARKFRATMGVMDVVAYVKSSNNEYVYNDTIHKRVNGISAITDLAAASIILDTSSLTEVKVELAIENRGARGANDFVVGFWVDNDSAHVYREIYHTSYPLPALHTGYHLFQATLPYRSTPYDHITAFVTVPDDNDPTNDTTTVFAPQFVDLAATEVLVEENSRPDCGVYITIRNNGNMAISGRAITLNASVNGNDLSYTVYIRLNPGEETTVKFNRTIPKDPLRRYSGSGSVDVSGDSDASNNQTTNVMVVNYVEGTPTVNEEKFVLEQNYPNPFSSQTTIPFTLPADANIRFFVMDATGHMVFSRNGFYHAGENTITLDMESFSAGIYYYGIETPDGRLMRKMILR